MKDKRLKGAIVLFWIAALFFLVIQNIDDILRFVGKLLSVSMPLFIGFAVAFVVYPPFAWLRKKLSSKIRGKAQKIIPLVCIVIVYLSIFALIGVIIAFLLPQLQSSVATLSSNLSGYADTLNTYIQSFMGKFHIENLDLSRIEQMIRELPKTLTAILSTMFPAFFNMTTNLVSGIINLFIGLVIGAYILCDMPRFKYYFVNLINAYLPTSMAEKTFYVGQVTFRTFTKYVAGQILEAIILGVLCFIGMILIGFEYPLLISVLIGVTGLIPIAGAFIGAIPAVFLLLMVNPSHALWFIPFILVIQQIEGDLIYPRVVGNSIGLPAFWVMVAIIIGGGLGGIIGMLISVPLCSVLYQLIETHVGKTLQDKNIQKLQ